MSGNGYGYPPSISGILNFKDHRVHTNNTNEPKVSKLQLPRTEEGAAVPIIYGRCRVTSPILIYAGKLQTLPQNNSNNAASYVVYALDMLFAVGIPMGQGTPTPTVNGPGFDWTKSPVLYNVWMGDQKLPAPNGGQLPGLFGVAYQGKNVNRPFFLGGKGSGGGLAGTYTFWGGWSDQSLTSPSSAIGSGLATVLGNSNMVPGHRRQMLVSFTNLSGGSGPGIGAWQDDNGSVEVDPAPDFGFVLGESPNIDGISMEVAAYGDLRFSMVQPGYDFGGDADPAEVIYDLLTNTWGRAGMDPALIDTSSLSTLSATLKAEGHGYSCAISSQRTASDILDEICTQTDVVRYVDPITGLTTFKAIRADYDPATIPSFDESNILGVDSYQMGTWRDLVNEVRVQYTDRTLLYQSATAVAQSFGNALGSNNRRNVKVFSLPGICNSTVAAQVASRKLNMLSVPLSTIKLTINRDAIDLRPGSVFKVTWGEYNLSGVIFRAQKVDLGKLDDNKITVTAVQDNLLTSTYAGLTNPLNVQAYTPPDPLATRTLVEAPKWLVTEAAASGVVTDPNLAHFLPLPVPSANAVKYALYTKQQGTTIADSALFNKFQLDAILQPFPIGFTILADYAREYEPYDTTHGLEISNVSGGQWTNIISTLGVAGFTATSDDISKHGKNLVMLIRSDGAMELIAFESMSDLGGGDYRLNNVWRGLLDTPPIGFKAGDRGVFVDASMIGMRGWNITKKVLTRIVPCSPNVLGSGKDPTDTYTDNDETDAQFGQSELACRSSLPLPPSDVTVDNEFATRNAGVYAATAGVGQVNPGYKTIALIEEAIDLYGFKRDRLSPTVHKGSDADDTLSDVSPTTYSIAARVANTSAAAGLNFGFSGSASPIGGQCLAGGGARLDGYGNVDVSLIATRVLASGDPLVGTGGLAVGDSLGVWRFPRCTVFAPFWRNLLGNVRWNYRNGTDDLWTTAPSSGTSAFAASAFAVSTSATYDPYFLAAGGSTTSLVRVQTVFASEWLPRGLTAYARIYIRNGSLNANDTGSLSLDFYDATGFSHLGSLTTGAIAGPTSNWKSISVSGAIPSGTALIRVTLTSTKVSGGSTHADTCFTEPVVRIGPLVGADVLTNGSFATYASPTFTGWTNDTNNFLQSSDGGPSGTFAQGSNNTSSVMHQDYALPDGHQYLSTFVLSFFFKSIQHGDSGTVEIAALDGSNNVLSSLSTESMNQDGGIGVVNTRWIKRLLHLDLPDGAAKVRVTITANRAVGNTTCGACFDEFVAFLFDDLPVATSNKLDFSAASTEIVSGTTQDFVLDAPTLPTPDFVLGGSDLGGYEVGWTDTAAHPVAAIAGQFGNGVASIDAYAFVRGTGASAVHVAANGLNGYTQLNLKLTDSWTVSVAFRIDTTAAWAACGLVGRMALGTGWGIGLDASGHGYALLRGAGATTATATVATQALNDGAYHKLTIVNDPVGQTITIYDELGNSASTSTATLGAIDGTTDSAQHLRIGRDSDDHDVMPGAIGRVYAWESVALTSGQVATLNNYAKDPTGKITTYTRTAAAYAFGPYDSIGNRTAYLATAKQIAQPYAKTLTVDSGTGYGLAVGKSATNLLVDALFTGANWALDAAATLTTGVAGPTGRFQSCTVVGDASDGLKAINIPLAASPGSVVVVFMAKASTGTPTLNLELRDSGDVVKGTGSVTLGTTWERYAVTISGWTGSTATGRIRFVSASGALTFSLAEVLCVTQGTDVPALLPLPNSTHGDYNATCSATISPDVAFNARGEIVAVGCGMIDSPTPTAGTVVQVSNGSNAKNEREVQIVAGSAGFRLAHTDGAASPATVNSTSAYSTYSSRVFTARGRWSRAGMLDNISPASFAEIAWTDDTHSTATLGGAGRTAAWTNDTTQSTIVKIGAGTAAPSDLVLRSVTVQWPESKLP